MLGTDVHIHESELARRSNQVRQETREQFGVIAHRPARERESADPGQQAAGRMKHVAARERTNIYAVLEPAAISKAAHGGDKRRPAGILKRMRRALRVQ